MPAPDLAWTVWRPQTRRERRAELATVLFALAVLLAGAAGVVALAFTAVEAVIAWWGVVHDDLFTALWQGALWAVAAGVYLALVRSLRAYNRVEQPSPWPYRWHKIKRAGAFGMVLPVPVLYVITWAVMGWPLDVVTFPLMAITIVGLMASGRAGLEKLKYNRPRWILPSRADLGQPERYMVTSHSCAAGIGVCREMVPPWELMCAPHWAILPDELKTRARQAYRNDQDWNDPPAEYKLVRNEAAAVVKKMRREQVNASAPASSHPDPSVPALFAAHITNAVMRGFSDGLRADGLDPS